MSSRLFFSAPRTARTVLVSLAVLFSQSLICLAEPAVSGKTMRLAGAVQQLQLQANTSRVIESDNQIPRMLVVDPQVVQVIPLAANRVRIAARNSGVTQVNFWTSDGGVHLLDVTVMDSLGELQMLLKSQFPACDLKVESRGAEVVISGEVDQRETMGRAISMADDYFPRVVSKIKVRGVQAISLHVALAEVSLDKLRKANIQWDDGSGNKSAVKNVAELVYSSNPECSGDVGLLYTGILENHDAFLDRIGKLRDKNVIRVLAKPTLLTFNGKKVNFAVGGEIPVQLDENHSQAVEFQWVGTKVTCVPTILDGGKLRLDIRPQIRREIEPSGQTDNAAADRFEELFEDVVVELKPGQTVVIGGLAHDKIEMEQRSVPGLSKLPWVGGSFEWQKTRVEPVEMLVIVTPEIGELAASADTEASRLEKNSRVAAGKPRGARH